MKTWKKLENLYEQITEDNVDSIWHQFFVTYLESIGYNHKAIDSLFEWGKGGHNWKALHPEDGQVEDFISLKEEMRYIYDRMSLDRLFRCHWIYNQYKDNKWKTHNLS